MWLKFYKSILSPIVTQLNLTFFGFNSQCKHIPTCSEYMHESIKSYGIIAGGAKGLLRLLSCR